MSMSYQQEHEVKILRCDLSFILPKLLSLGAVLQFSDFQKRYIFDVPSAENSTWLRLRTRGDQSSLTLKKIDSAHNTHEIEVAIGSADSMLSLLKELGISPRAYQENHRVLFELDGAEICIDHWPGLSPFLEIEGKNWDSVLQTVRVLGFSENEISSLSIVDLYEKNGVVDIQNKDLSFQPDEREEIIRSTTL